MLVCIAAFAFGAMLADCNSSTSVNGGMSVITIPGTGSFFIKYNNGRDSNGVVTGVDTSTETFDKTGIYKLGKYNTEEIVYRYNSSTLTGTSYSHYEPNGDVTLYTSLGGVATLGWYTYPFGSQGTSRLFDSVNYEDFRITVTAVGAGSGSVIIKDQLVPTERIVVTTTERDTISGTLYGNYVIDTMQFAPSLGWIVQEDSHRDNYSGGMKTFAHTGVIDYTLR
jgi:hypothetical protein